MSPRIILFGSLVLMMEIMRDSLVIYFYSGGDKIVNDIADFGFLLFLSFDALAKTNRISISRKPMQTSKELVCHLGRRPRRR